MNNMHEDEIWKEKKKTNKNNTVYCLLLCMNEMADDVMYMQNTNISTAETYESTYVHCPGLTESKDGRETEQNPLKTAVTQHARWFNF